MPPKKSSSSKPAPATKNAEADKKDVSEAEAAAAAVDDDDGETTEPQEKGERGEASKAMQNVTGYVQESAGNEVDQAKLSKAMDFLKDASKKEKALLVEKPKEQEKIVLSKEDIELIMSEMQVTKPFAERHLREHKGDVVETLRDILTLDKPLR